MGDSFVTYVAFLNTVAPLLQPYSIQDLHVEKSRRVLGFNFVFDKSYILLSIICIVFIHQLQCVMHKTCIAVGSRIVGTNNEYIIYIGINTVEALATLMQCH